MVERNRPINTNLLKQIFSFPETINEYAARIVAFFVLSLTSLFLYTENIYILYFLAYGFYARVLAGPTLSPIALLATKVIIPILGEPFKVCPGPPKRFAQFIGLVFTTSSIILIHSGNLQEATYLLGILIFFAGLESSFGFCAGCWFFKLMMNWGWIPEKTCEQCNDISLSNT